MGFYDKYVLPRVLNWTCSAKPVSRQRQKIVPFAEGRVLEIGIGSGLNLPYYDAEKVEHLIGLDPANEMLDFARRKSAALSFPVEYLALEGETIPLKAQTIDHCGRHLYALHHP